MLFAFIAKDKANSVGKRLALRPEHLEYLKPPVLRLAGPFFNDKNEMVGSLMILEAADKAAAQAWLAEEPFFKGGLFEVGELHVWKPTLNFVGAKF
jgi:uncharacterized protein YciI